MNPDATRKSVDELWDSSIVPTLEEYIRIPNESPAYDPDWREHGHMERAVTLAKTWVDGQGIAGLRSEVVRLDGRTPLLFIEVPGEVDDTVLLYGHLDKQPPMLPWADGLGPWQPVIRDGRLYGRGGADDGYACFASVAAVRALRQQGVPHARAVMVIECCEESGSYDLPPYIEHFRQRIGQPSLVVCLDSGCGDYDRLWMTTSLRGAVGGPLKVEVLREGVHSGAASGVVPSSFRILRQLLSRLEDEITGTVKPDALKTEIPKDRLEEAAAAARILGDGVYREFPFVSGMQPVTSDLTELLLNKTWRPQLAVTGADGLPPLAQAGNVLRPQTAAQLSLRLPPGVDPKLAERTVKELLERDPPYGAKVDIEMEWSAAGWNAPPTAPWLAAAVEQASNEFFGKDPCSYGEGGTIPFMAMLGERFPDAQFLITGVLGPQSNAHGPNEFLDIATGKRVTACVARVLAAHAAR